MSDAVLAALAAAVMTAGIPHPYHLVPDLTVWFESGQPDR
jgi:hypothetical protein